MSDNQLMTNPSLLDEINMLVKGNEDLTTLISDVLKKRRTFPNSSGPGSSSERPRQVLTASSTESCDSVPPDELSLCPEIENVAAKLSKIVLSDVEGSPLSNPFLKHTILRAYEDFADDEASSDDSCDSLSSWLTIESSDADSKYPSTLDDYGESSFDESSGSVCEESNNGTSPPGKKDANGNYQLVGAGNEKCEHCSSTTEESNSDIEVLKDQDKSASSDDSCESNDKLSNTSKTVDSCDGQSKHYNSTTESNSDIEVLKGEDKSASSDDSSESNDKISNSSKTVDYCDEKLNHCSSTESDSDTKAKVSEKKSDRSDDSSESDENSSDSSKTVDLEEEQFKNYSSTDSNGYLEVLESENESDSSSEESNESEEKSSDDSTAGKESMEEADGERITGEKDSSEESNDYTSSESGTSESEQSSNNTESSARDSSEASIRSDGDSTDSSTRASSENSDSSEADVNQSRKNPSSSSSVDEVWIEPRRRLSDWGDSSLIQSDDSLVCMKAGEDKIIISKRNKIGEIQAIYFFPDFVKWRGSSTSKIESDPEASSSSNDSESPTPGAAEKIQRQHKRYKSQVVNILKKETSSSDEDLLRSELTGAACDSTTSTSLEESEDNAELSPSYKKYSSISEDLSPRNELNDEQRGPQSHNSNTYRKFSDVDGRM